MQFDDITFKLVCQENAVFVEIVGHRLFEFNRLIFVVQFGFQTQLVVVVKTLEIG